MAGFSYLFMNRALDRWFTQIPENVVREAREVQVKATRDQQALVQESARMLATSLDGQKIGKAELDEIAVSGSLTFIEILTPKNEVIASAGDVVGCPEERGTAAESRRP